MHKGTRWLYLIAAPAAVVIWSGWVGLGGLCGFGPVRLFPGISGFTLDTAIALPVGMEAYGAYALRWWLAPGDVPQRARVFARWSAIGALALGMLAQVAFHLLSADRATRAPSPVVVAVSCAPVITLGFAAALAHLLRSEVSTSEAASEDHPVSEAASAPGNISEKYVSGTSQPAPGPAPVSAPAPVRERTRRAPRRTAPGAPDPIAEFAAEITSGALPSLRQIRARMHVGQDRAHAIRAELERALEAEPADPEPGQERILKSVR